MSSEVKDGKDQNDSLEPEEIHECFTIRLYTNNSELGYAAFATKHIPKHTLILTEEPILIDDQIKNAILLHENGTHTCQEDDAKYLSVACSLDTYKIDRIWHMHDQYVHSYKTPELRLWGIIYSNAFYSTDKNFAPGLYPTAARLNHSCMPNVGYEFAGTTMRMYVTRDIKIGEELCDCYSDVVYHYSQKVRKAFLKEKYGFDCQCVLCRDVVFTEDDVLRLKKSNKQRERLKEIAIVLRDRLDADILYSSVFAKEVKMIAFRNLDDKCNKNDGCDLHDYVEADNIHPRFGHHRNAQPSSRKKFKPRQYDLDMLLEYIELLESEGIDHDIAPIYELLYDVATYLGNRECIVQYKVAEKCLELCKVSKGERHRQTKKFRSRLQKDWGIRI